MRYSDEERRLAALVARKSFNFEYQTNQHEKGYFTISVVGHGLRLDQDNNWLFDVLKELKRLISAIKEVHMPKILTFPAPQIKGNRAELIEALDAYIRGTKNIKGIEKLPGLPSNFDWDDISITFLSETLVRVSVAGKKIGEFTPAEFHMHRKNTTDEASSEKWKFLRKLAIASREPQAGWKEMGSKISHVKKDLNTTLCALFGLSGEPIIASVGSVIGYQSQFDLQQEEPEFHRETCGRDQSYNDNVQYGPSEETNRIED